MRTKKSQEKDKKILQLLSDGKTASEIASALGANVRTIEAHIFYLKTFWGATNVTHLACTALREKIIK